MELPINNRQPEAKPRASRHEAKGNLLVQAKTIGSVMSYVLNPKNASVSGFLLTWDKEHKLPFAINTILELAIHPNFKSSQRLPCLGKIVRKVDGDGKRVEYGIKIVQMDNAVQEQWQQFVQDMERKTNALPAA